MQFFFPKPSQNPNPNPLQTLQSHLSTALSRLQTITSHPPSPLFAHIPSPSPPKPAPAEIGERLTGVPVYALSNTEREFMLVCGVKTGKALALMCFKKEDAEALLDQMRAMSPRDETASEVVSVALNKVIQVKVNNVAFRFVPDSQQVLNAIKGETVKEQIGISTDGFAGVPVFQSRSLVLRSDNKKYNPAFFRKEDLDESLRQTAQLQNQLNPAFRRGDVQVSTLEEIISDMKENSMSKWNDIVFIPPGFDMSNQLGKGNRPTAIA